MTEAVAHRGPDGDGFWYGAKAAFGHRRLAILDLETGDQPMRSNDGRITVTFNGEIYNHHDLRQQLEARGHVFRTRSDTEVLVHGFREWGVELPSRLLGMFAFLAHDEVSGETLLARDPLGKKPLFFCERDGHVLVASEIKSFLVLPGASRAVDPEALCELLALRYVPGPRTFLRGYEELAPGSLALHRPGERITAREYWRPEFAASEQEHPVEALRELFLTCVADRLEADVPLGAFLSGGVDSSGVVAGMRQVGADVAAVTVGFEDAAHDERAHARQVARRFDVDLREEVLRPDLEHDLDTLATAFDLPMTDSSAWPTLLVCRAAREHVKVALSGDGGDECFAGYRRYRFDLLENRLRRFVPAVGARLAGRIAPKADWLPRPLRVKRTLENLGCEPVEAYLRSVSALLPGEAAELVAPDVGRGIDPFSRLTAAYHAARAEDHMGRVQALDLRSYLVGDILTKVDRCSMAVSLEVRSPLLDRRIVDFAGRLAAHEKIDARSGKKILKRVFEPWLGRELLERPKQGFSIPLAEWLRGPLRDLRQAAIDGSFAADYLNRATLDRWAKEHDSGVRDRSEPLWATLMLHLWKRRWGTAA